MGWGISSYLSLPTVPASDRGSLTRSGLGGSRDIRTRAAAVVAGVRRIDRRRNGAGRIPAVGVRVGTRATVRTGRRRAGSALAVVVIGRSLIGRRRGRLLAGMHGRQRIHGLGSRVAVGVRRRLGEGASGPRVVGRISPGGGWRVAELGVLDGGEGHGGAHGRQAWLLVLHASVVVVARWRRVLRFLPGVPRGGETTSTSIVCHDPIANWRNGRQGGSCAAVLGFFCCCCLAC